MKTDFMASVEIIYFLGDLQNIWKTFIAFQILPVGELYLQSTLHTDHLGIN